MFVALFCGTVFCQAVVYDYVKSSERMSHFLIFTGGMKDTDKSKLVDFVHPGSLKAPVIDKMLEKIQYSKPKTQNDTEKTIFSNVNYHAFQLEKRLSLIDKLCLAANK